MTGIVKNEDRCPRCWSQSEISLRFALLGKTIPSGKGSVAQYPQKAAATREAGGVRGETGKPRKKLGLGAEFKTLHCKKLSIR